MKNNKKLYKNNWTFYTTSWFDLEAKNYLNETGELNIKRVKKINWLFCLLFIMYLTKVEISSFRQIHSL